MANMIYGNRYPSSSLAARNIAPGAIYVEIECPSVESAPPETTLWIKSPSERWVCLGLINGPDPTRGYGYADIGCWQVATRTWNDRAARTAVANIFHHRRETPFQPTPQGCIVLLYHLTSEPRPPVLPYPAPMRIPAQGHPHWGEVRQYSGGASRWLPEDTGKWHLLDTALLSGNLIIHDHDEMYPARIAGKKVRVIR